MKHLPHMAFPKKYWFWASVPPTSLPCPRTTAPTQENKRRAPSPVAPEFASRRAASAGPRFAPPRPSRRRSARPSAPPLLRRGPAPHPRPRTVAVGRRSFELQDCLARPSARPPALPPVAVRCAAPRPSVAAVAPSRHPLPGPRARGRVPVSTTAHGPRAGAGRAAAGGRVVTPALEASHHCAPREKGCAHWSGRALCGRVTRRGCGGDVRWGAARMSSKSGGGGGGGLGPKSSCTKSGPIRFPYCKFRLFPRWSLWSGGGGGSSYGCQPF